MIETLLIDDENSFLELAKTYLEKKNEELKIETNNSPKKALELIKKDSFDCVVCDYQMPKLNGLQVLQKIRNDLDNDIPFVMFTGKGREEVAMKALNLGANRYLQKGGNPKTQFGVLSDAIKQEVEHYETKKALEEREKKYRRLVETAGDIILIHDKKGKIEFINQAGLNFSGYSKKEVENKNIKDFIPKEEIPDLIERKKQRTKEKKKDRLKFETKFINKNGKKIDVDIESNSLIENGEFKGELVVARDITEQKKKEEKLKKNEKRLNESQRVANVGSWEIDLDTGELTWSDETYRIFGLPIGEPVTYDEFLEFIHPEDRDYVDKEWNEALETGEYDIDHRIVVDDEIKWVHEKADIIYNDNGEPIKVIGSVQDITERKKSKEREELLHSLLRHDVQNQNQVIEGYLDLLKEDLEEPYKYLEKAKKACKISQDIIEKVKTLKRVEKETIKEVDLKPLIQEVLQKNRTRAKEKGFEIIENCPYKSCKVKAGSLLKELFKNLIENAINHSKGNKIKISGKEKENTVICSIEDNGKGIPDKQKDKIFKRGF